ncbi:MAG TPA: NAD(P)H-hydrate dehydratase [Candidatus Binatia bacterium]|nr:NAD(P)H-hydrate dehydratase [Candidatus Binatia bacterium]
MSAGAGGTEGRRPTSRSTGGRAAAGRRGARGGGTPSGLPGEATWLTEAEVAALVPERPLRGHKGTFGKLLVIAGSLDFAGAALLVCRAAGRAGAGLVTLAVPESLQPLFAAKVVEATTMALPEDDVEEVDPEPALARILDHDHDALVVGPGLRPGLATTELVRLLLAETEEPAAVPAVLDAEALRSLASLDGWWRAVRRPCILTPHAGEFARLRAASGRDPSTDGDLNHDDAARIWAATDAADRWGQVVVLKGAHTVVAAPGRTGRSARPARAWVAPFANPALASGGTGDVLAGTIGALLAQGLETAAAARLGVFLHGLAGEAVRARLGDAGLLAGDLPDELPLARRRLVALRETAATDPAVAGPPEVGA